MFRLKHRADPDRLTHEQQQRRDLIRIYSGDVDRASVAWVIYVSQTSTRTALDGPRLSEPETSGGF